MKSIVLKDSGVSWLPHLKALASQEGIIIERITITSKADAIQFEKQLAVHGMKKASNEHWECPFDPDARITEVDEELRCREAAADKGYFKNEPLPIISQLGEGLRSYISEPRSPKGRTWIGMPAEQEAAYRANHRRVNGERGMQLLRRCGQVVERPFAHRCETGEG